MNYLGGKFRQGRVIAEHIIPHIEGKVYIEPFCGAMGSSSAVVKAYLEVGARPKQVILSDCQEPLINMWKTLLGGWDPPEVVDQDTYDYYKAYRPIDDPMTAYVGYGLSFGGKYWGGYARNKTGYDYVLSAKRSTMFKVNVLLKANILLKVCDYRSYIDRRGCVFYLDPPYKGRTRQFAGTFDHNEFWDFTRVLARNNIVFVSEYIAPDDFRVVYSWGDTVVRHYSSKGVDGTNECLFVYNVGGKSDI